MSGTKKSKDIGEHTYKLGDVVLAKVRGYPQWPGRVVDPDSVPPDVAKERPTNKKTTFYCVQFFPAGDYYWAVSKDLSLLQKHEIEAYINEPHKKSGDLLQGYKIALNPAKWEESLAEQRGAAEDAEASAEIDELDEADEGDETDTKKNKNGRKRKRESESKPKKKKESKKDTGTSADTKKTTAKRKVGRKNGIKNKETIESEDDGGVENEGVGESSKKSTGPASKKARKDKGGDGSYLDHLANNPEAIKVKEWRHRLQRAFLSKSIPKPEEMPEYDQLFTTIESHELTIDQLQFSKLGKVMRHIAQIDQRQFPIPSENEYSIQKRAMTLLDKWQGLVAASGGEGNTSVVNGAGGAAQSAAEVKGDPAKKDSEKDAPVNGDVHDAKPADSHTESAAPPTAEEAVAMDTADD